jgi:hypothetical protein
MWGSMGFWGMMQPRSKTVGGRRNQPAPLHTGDLRRGSSASSNSSKGPDCWKTAGDNPSALLSNLCPPREQEKLCVRNPWSQERILRAGMRELDQNPQHWLAG